MNRLAFVLGAAALFAACTVPSLAARTGAAPSPAAPSERLATTQPSAPQPASDVDNSTDSDSPTAADNNALNLALHPEQIQQNSDSVAAIVNSDVITDYDLRQRVALFVATSGVQPTPDALKKIRAQILDQLETEQLQIQEAKRKHITVSMPEVDKAIDKIVAENHLNLDQLKAVLAKNGVNFTTLRAQIAAQLIWQKTVEDEFQGLINVSDSQIDAELSRQSEGADKPHYLVSVIFLAVETPEDDDKVLKNITDLSSQLQTGAPFPNVARQFSQSPSAASGGDLGWVHDGQLAPELNDALRKMTPGTISAPIRSTGGYYILALRERQEAAGTKLPEQPVDQGPKDRLPLARILLPLGPKPSQQIAESAMKLATQISQHVSSCDHLEKLSQQIHGSVYMNLGEMKLTDLSAQMQAELAKTQSGQPTEPFVDSAGVEIIFRCDKAVPKLTAFQMPTRQEVEEQLFDQQVTAFARRYIRDLRRQADVETR